MNEMIEKEILKKKKMKHVKKKSGRELMHLGRRERWLESQRSSPSLETGAAATEIRPCIQH